MTERSATSEDTQGILNLLRLMEKETALAPANWGKVVHIIDHCDKIFIYELHGIIVGAHALCIREWWWSDHKMIGDIFLYVHPDHRTSQVANKLLRCSKNWAKQKGLPLVIAPFTVKDTARKNKLFSRGMKPIGEFYLQEAV